MEWNKFISEMENLMDHQARVYYRVEGYADEVQNRINGLRQILFGTVESDIHNHFKLINDRIQKSIIVGGNAVFIHPYTNHVINAAYTVEEFCRLASENGNAIIVYNRADGTFIPNDEPVELE